MDRRLWGQQRGFEKGNRMSHINRTIDDANDPIRSKPLDERATDLAIRFARKHSLESSIRTDLRTESLVDFREEREERDLEWAQQVLGLDLVGILVPIPDDGDKPQR